MFTLLAPTLAPPVAPPRPAFAPPAPALDGEHLALSGGRHVLVRPVRPDDTLLEQAFVAALSPRARQLRFHMGMSALSDAMARMLVQVDARAHVALIAESRSNLGGPAMVADARYAVIERTDEADFAIVVADAWQGLGLGRALMLRLAQRARQQGVRRLRGDVLRQNHRMQAVVQGLGGRIVESQDDASVLVAQFDL